jgi:FixJ family two-component response regulator
MGGAELARRLHGAHPDLKVIYISGYADVAVGLPGHPGGLLRKPFNGAQLLGLVAQAMRTPR